MSKFFKTITEVAVFVDVARDLNFAKFEKHLIAAERELKVKFGPSFFNELTSLDINYPEQLEILNSIKEYIANKALLRGINGLNLDISNAGVNTTKPTNQENAPWYKIKDYARDLMRNSTEALDYAITLIELSEDFESWENSDLKQNLADCKIKNLSQFEQYFSLNKSYSTFFDLVPFIKEAQLKYIDPLLGECLNSELSQDLNKDIIAALVNLTVATVAETGVFKLENNGALIKLEVLPWEKVDSISDLKLTALKEQRFKTAELYLSKIITKVKQLPCYVAPNIIGKEIERKKVDCIYNLCPSN